MAPQSPWNKKTTQGNPKKHANTKPPNTPAPAQPARGQTDYEEAKKNEFEALAAIYMDDFQEVETKGAWNKTSDQAFTLRIRSFADSHVFVTLHGKLSATYPKTVPILAIQESQAPKAAVKAIESLVKTQPKELVGDVMIHSIADDIVRILDDAVDSRDKKHVATEALPSLEEERAVKKAEAVQLQQQKDEEIRKQRDAEKADKQRGLQERAELVVSLREQQRERDRRQQDSGQLYSPVDRPRDASKDTVKFERSLTMQIEGQITAFSAVDRVVQIRQGPLTTVFTAQPVTAESPSVETALILKRFRVPRDVDSKAKSNDSKMKKMIVDLEAELENLRKLRHDSAIGVIEFSIDVQEAAWNVNVLVDYANKGSLQEMLEVVASVPSETVRIWTVQLLEALDYYHRHSIVHKRIHADNILLSRSMASGSTSLKLSDAAFQSDFYDITAISTISKPKRRRSQYATWTPPECDADARKTIKTDIFEAGVIFVQMLFGIDATQKFNSPAALINGIGPSSSLEELLLNFLREDPKKRHKAFDLLPSEFFRDHDVPIFEHGPHDHAESPVSLPTALDRNNRGRRGSTLGFGEIRSRYNTDWALLGRLGRGGYGEVVKARHHLDGRIYAIKKIACKTPTDLTNILSEVMLLSRLNHSYVVRYYTAWPENELATATDASDNDDAPVESPTNDDVSSMFMPPTLADFGPSNRGLDFVSSSGNIKFANDSDDSDDSDSDDDEVAVESDGESTESRANTHNGNSENGQHKKLDDRRTTSDTRRERPLKATLYIQMEFCEKHTLRDLIVKDLFSNVDEGWKLFRQILEGLAHIHEQGIIHRDLKPDNIFLDVHNNPKIGDFGLATLGQHSVADKSSSGSNGASGDMTRSVGTALYVAPELSSQGSGNYTAKVDMYSLGIIFFEMCFPLKTAMERVMTIKEIRLKEHELPDAFAKPEKAIHGQIVKSLISHEPSERPSSSELLRSGKVPVQIEDGTIKEALRGLADTSSPFYTQMMSALFSQPHSDVKDLAWDMKLGAAQENVDDAAQAETELLHSQVKAMLKSVFRRHGALRASRPVMFPFSHHYKSSNSVVKMLDSSGNLVQLPYDLTLPYARQIAKQRPTCQRTYTFGNVYRDQLTGSAPSAMNEADFDIVSYNAEDLVIAEAEVIKVVDEIVGEVPSFKEVQMCFHLNHSDLLEVILDFCRVPKSQRPAVKEVISKLNVQSNTWQKIKAELRAPAIGVSSTSLDDLARFDFRDSSEKALKKIRSIMEGSSFASKAQHAIKHLRDLIACLKLFQIRSKIYICPLISYNERFYSGGILFQCLSDNKRHEVLAAGGRYDSLVEEFRTKTRDSPLGAMHAVGVNIGWDRLVASMARLHRKDAPKPRIFQKHQAPDDGDSQPAALRRCDVLVAAFDPDVLRSAGVKILTELWKMDISAEMSIDAHNVEELQSQYRSDNFNWLVIIKQDSFAGGSGSGKPEIKIRNLATRDETDVYTSNLIPHLVAQLRERDHREAVTERERARHHARSGTGSEGFPERAGSMSAKADNKVQILVAQHRSRKSNNYQIVEAARARAREFLHSNANAAIIAVECGEQAMEMMRGVRVGDAEGWKRVVQAAPLNERQYLGQILDELVRLASGGGREEGEGEGEGQEGAGGKAAFVYNFRTGACLLFDLVA